MVHIPASNTKTSKARTFVITSELAEIVKKYIKLRPKNTPSKSRFLIKYINNACVRSNIGKTKVGSVAKDIATWLGLDNPKNFTGRALRRTSATLLSNGGGSMMDVKLFGTWESDKVAQGYVDNSVTNKLKIANIVSKGINPSTSKVRMNE